MAIVLQGVLPALALIISIFVADGNIIRPCPQTYSSYYLADDTDPCVFFWCLSGELVTAGPMACAPGSGVKPGYGGEGNPCTLHLPGCKTSSGTGTSHGNGNQGGWWSQGNGGTSNQGGYQNGGSNQGGYQGSNNQGGYQGGSNQGGYQGGSNQGGHQGGSNQGGYQGGSNQGSNQGGHQGGSNQGGSQGGHHGGSSQGSSSHHHGGSKGGKYWIVPIHLPAPTPSPTPAPTTAPTPEPTGQGVTGQGSGGHGHGDYQPGQQGHYAATAYLTQNAHIPGGDHQPHVNSMRYCWKACVHSLECKGFDYDTHYGTCWLHTDATICGVLEAKPHVNSYRLVHCPSTTPQASTTVTMPTDSMTTSSMVSTASPTVKSPIANFTGMHIPGGSLQTGANSLDACFAACVNDVTCQGVDFDTNGNTCWLHTMTSECMDLVAKPTCTHYRCVQCQAPVIFPNAHALGGTLIPGISSPTECFAMCVGTCVAIDFDSATMTCWHHTALTCNTIEIKAQCVHFRRDGMCP